MEYGCQVVHNLGIHIIMLGRVLFMFEVNTNTEETTNLQNISTGAIQRTCAVPDVARTYFNQG